MDNHPIVSRKLLRPGFFRGLPDFASDFGRRACSRAVVRMLPDGVASCNNRHFEPFAIFYPKSLACPGFVRRVLKHQDRQQTVSLACNHFVGPACINRIDLANVKPDDATIGLMSAQVRWAWRASSSQRLDRLWPK